MLLQIETDSTHATKFELLLCSKLADVELHFELLTSGVERLAVFSTMSLSLPQMSLKFYTCFIEQTSPLDVQCVACCDTIRAGLFCIIFERHPLSPAHVDGLARNPLHLQNWASALR